MSVKHLLLAPFLLVIVLFYHPASGQTHKDYTPTPFPDRLILGWQGETATSQSVNWRTDSTITGSVGEIAEADASPGFLLKTTKIPAISEMVSVDGKKTQYHSVHFKDLKPETQYSYRVGNGTYWSEWFHFKTASQNSKPFSFLYFGDAQVELRSLWSRAVRGAFATLPKVSFMIHAGDLVTTANADWQWGEWHEASGWINGMVPSLASPGNHEYYKGDDGKRHLTYQWRPSFVLPENGPDQLKESAYYIDYQGVRFISLDSEAALQDESIMDIQADWFEKVVKNNPNKWTIVIHHHPLYSTKSGRDNKEWRDKMEPLYIKHKIDMVLQGHDHTYGRGMNLPAGKSRKLPKGPIYVVSVSGTKMYDIGLQEWMDRAASNVQLYQAIAINQNKLEYKAYTVTGDLYDAFELSKSAAGVNTLTEKTSSLLPERLDLPESYQKRYTEEQMDEYNRRFKEYKARKIQRLKN